MGERGQERRSNRDYRLNICIMLCPLGTNVFIHSIKKSLKSGQVRPLGKYSARFLQILTEKCSKLEHQRDICLYVNREGFLICKYLWR